MGKIICCNVSRGVELNTTSCNFKCYMGLSALLRQTFNHFTPTSLMGMCGPICFPWISDPYNVILHTTGNGDEDDEDEEEKSDVDDCVCK